MNKYLLFFFFFIGFGAINASQNQLSKETKEPSVEFLSSLKADLLYKVRDLYNDPANKRYATETFVASQRGIIKCMNDAAQREDTKVHLTVGAHAVNNLEAYKVTTLRQNKKAHAKITVALAGSPKKTAFQKGCVIAGSPNISNNWENQLDPSIRYNLETAIKIDSPQLAEEAYEMIISDSPMKNEDEKTIVQTTPKKPSIFSSKDTDLNGSLAQRLKNLAKDTNKDRAAYIQTMTLNDKNVVSAAIKVKKSGANVEIIVDRAALTDYGLPLLRKLEKAGIPVYVFYPDDEKYRVIHHSKAKNFVKGDLYMHQEDTGNITIESNSDTNYSLLLLNKKITEQSIENFEKTKKLCKSLKQAEELKEKDDAQAAEKKREKRKAEKEAKSAPVQKKAKK